MNIHHYIFKILEKKNKVSRMDTWMGTQMDNMKTVYSTTNKVCQAWGVGGEGV